MQSVIVYRNPMEAQFWETINNDPYIIVIGAVFFLATVASFWILAKFQNKIPFKFQQFLTFVPFIIGIVASVVTFKILY